MGSIWAYPCIRPISKFQVLIPTTAVSPVTENLTQHKSSVHVRGPSSHPRTTTNGSLPAVSNAHSTASAKKAINVVSAKTPGNSTSYRTVANYWVTGPPTGSVASIINMVFLLNCKAWRTLYACTEKYNESCYK